jgi:hypothetical protein
VPEDEMKTKIQKNSKGRKKGAEDVLIGAADGASTEPVCKAPLSPYRPRAFDRSLKKNMPGKLFFCFRVN